MKCRNAGRRVVRARRARGTLVACVLGLACSCVPLWAGPSEPAGAVGSTTPTTTPGPAPNQSQINATQSQISAVEATLAKEEQESSALDNRYIDAQQAEQNAQNAVASLDTSIAGTRAQVAADKRRLAADAVNAYIYNTPQSKFDSLFSTSISLGDARNQYVVQIVGNLDQARNALETTEAHLAAERSRQVAAEAQAQSEAAQTAQLAQANAAEAAQTKSTLSQVQGTLAQEVAQAAIEEAQAEAAAAARAASQAQAEREAAAAAAAAAIAGAVGGSASGAAATEAANQASGTVGDPGPVQGTGSGTGGQMSAVQAAESQLGVPYVWGGDSPSTGFDCSGLVQWAWGQAGVSIPRTTEAQWAALAHVPLNALEPGDLLYYYNLDGDDAVDHVVMYVGSGPYGSNTIIQAPFTGADVSYSPIYTEGLIGAARP